MNEPAAPGLNTNKWLVYGAVCLPFLFINFATFISLGIVLRPMIGEMHWTFTQAGTSFTVLGLGCGLTSPLPAITIKRYGARLTFCTGTVLLFIGFLLASLAQDLPSFYAGMGFVGVGFTFTGNVPGVYMISTWFRVGAGRLIGFYLMLGALGAAFAPPIVEAIVKTEGWRGHWRAMAIVAAIMGVACFAGIRDPDNKAPGIDGVKSDHRPDDWTVGKATKTYQFALMAFAIAFTMTGITTIESIVVPHLAKLSAAPQTALVLSLIAITSTGFKGITGRLSESIRPAYLVAAGLALQAGGDGILMIAATAPLQYAGAVCFGAGWGLCIVAGTVGILDFFGPDVGARAMSIVALMITVGVLGPIAAGAVGDTYGTFAPIFLGSMVILIALAIPIALMPRPSLGRRPDIAPSPMPVTEAV